MALLSKQSKLLSNKGKPKAFASAPGNSAPGKKKGQSRMSLIAVAVVVIIILAAAYSLLSAGGSSAITLTTNKTLSLSPNQTILIESGSSSSPAAIQMANYSGGSYTFLITKAPVLANPVYMFTLTQGQVVNLSYSGSSTADLQAKLISGSNTVAMVEFIPIPASFGVRATTLATLNSGGSGQQTTASTTVAATTTASATTSAGTATTSATTTVAQNTGSYTNAQVLASANLTQDGLLMKNFKALYNKDQACTSPTYNATYFAQLHSNATAPNDYPNVTRATPYDINETISYISGSTYYVNYSTVSHLSATAGPALSLEINAQSGQTVAATFKGLYQGSTYSSLESTYLTQSGISGNCGAYIP